MGSDGCQTALQRLELSETQNTECGLIKFARVAGHCTGWAKGRPAFFSRFVYVVGKKLLWEHRAKGPRCHIYFDGSSKAWLRGASYRPTIAWL